MKEGRLKGDTSLTDLRRLRHQMPRWVLVLLACGVAAFVAFHITHLLIMLIAATVVAYIFSSVITAFERFGIKRSVAVIMLFVLTAVFVIGADLIFIPDLKQEIMHAYGKFPEFSRQIQDALC